MQNNTERLGNIYGDDFGTGYAGNVWSVIGICPTLRTFQGGNAQPLVVVKSMKNKTVCERRYDEGLRTFADGTIGSIRTIDSGGGKTSDRIH